MNMIHSFFVHKIMMLIIYKFMKKKKILELLLKARDQGVYHSSPLAFDEANKVIEDFERECSADLSITDTDVDKLVFKDLSELVTGEVITPDWLIEGIVPRGQITFISGAPSSYKSWLLYDMAIKISSGNDFLGKFKVKKSDVLIIDEENGKNIIQQRFQKLGGVCQGIKYLSMAGVGIKDFSFIIDKCKEENISTVVIDSFIRIHTKDENSSGEMSKIYQTMKEFKNNNISLLVAHHNRKQQGPFQVGGGEQMRGSSDILAFLDCQLSVVKNKKDNIIEMTQNKLRITMEQKPFKIGVENNEDKIVFFYLGEGDSQIKKKEASSAIINILSSEHEANKKEIIKKVQEVLKDISVGVINETLLDLVESDKVVMRKGAGNTHLYFISPENLKK